MSDLEYRPRIKDLPTEQRPREKLTISGPGSLSTAELLAIIIRTGTPALTAVGLAQKVISHFGGLRSLINLNVEELQEIRGIGLAKGAQIVAALEFSRRIAASIEERPRISSPQDVARLLFPRMRYLQQEVFDTVLLSTKNQVLGIPRISVGSLNSSIVHPREVFKPAIKRSAAALILAHNHPSGDPGASQEDIKVTRRLKEAGEILGIDVLDHLIIGDGKYQSLKEKGII